MDLSSCLARIRHVGQCQPTVETLRTVQRSFLETVPFENLDIHLGKEIDLSSHKIFEKIVTMRRGGVCYERTILFHDLLQAIGFRVKIISARMVKGSSVGPEYDYMALIVTLEHPYLLDVGDGHCCREPLRIDGSNHSTSEGYCCRAGPCGDAYALYRYRAESERLPRFYFTVKPRHVSEFEPMNILHQASGDSSLTRHRIVTMATKEGRVSLIDRRLIVKTGSAEHRMELASEREYRLCLDKRFGIKIPSIQI